MSPLEPEATHAATQDVNGAETSQTGRLGARLSPRYTWYAIFILSLVFAFNYMDRMALAMLMPLVKEELHLSDMQLGLMLGLAFSLFFAICGIPIARWADRGIRRNIIAIALAMWSAMTALTGAAQNTWHLFLARVGVGAGEAGCLPPSLSLICDYVPVQRRSGVFAIHQCGAYAGLLFTMALAGWLGETIGWRWTFVALGLPGIALAVIVRLTLREPVRGSFDEEEDDKPAAPSLGETIRVLWSRRTYRLMMVFYVINGFVQYGLNQWLPSFYARVHGLSLASVGVYLGIALAVGAAIGTLAGGLLANKAAQRDVRLPLILSAVGVLSAMPAALGSLFVSSSQASMWLTALTALLIGIPNGPTTAAMYSVTPSSMRATAAAIAVFVISVFGLTLGPFSVGLLSDILAPSLGMHSLRYALLAPVCFLPVMVITLYSAIKTLRQDLTSRGRSAETQDPRVNVKFSVQSSPMATEGRNSG